MSDVLLRLTLKVTELTLENERLSRNLRVAQQNREDIAHCFSDLRRFIGAKWPGISDLPSEEALLINGPEYKHETDAMISALNRVADFYEGACSHLNTGIVKDD